MTVKAVLHIHSAWSYDGKWNLSKIANFFGTLGYDLILTAEHDRTFDDESWVDYQKACLKASTKRTLIIPGMEYSDADNIVHILVWGVSEFLGKNLKTGDLLQKANIKKGICVLAHPGRRNAWQKLEKSWIPLLHGIEIWNRKFDGIAPSQEAVEILRANHRIVPFAGLDFHQANQAYPLSMSIVIDGTLSTENVFHALRKSQCAPMVYGLSATHFTKGMPFSISKIADRARRTLSRIIKH